MENEAAPLERTRHTGGERVEVLADMGIGHHTDPHRAAHARASLWREKLAAFSRARVALSNARPSSAGAPNSAPGTASAIHGSKVAHQDGQGMGMRTFETP
jgi:hypothetical protein